MTDFPLVEGYNTEVKKNPETLEADALSSPATQEKKREKTHLLDSLAVLGRGGLWWKVLFWRHV